MSLRSRLSWFLRSRLEPGEVEAEIEEELRYHLEMRTRDYLERGLGRSEAEERAGSRFGDLSGIRAECRRLAGVGRARKGDSLMSTFASDLRFALRSLVKSPGFTLVVVSTLALGIGANSAVFSLVEGILLRPLPYADPERLVNVWENDRVRGTRKEGFSAPDFFDLARENDVFEDVALYGTASLTLTAEGSEPASVRVATVSRNLFELLGVLPLRGRGIRAEDDVPGASPVVVLGYGIWMRRFGGNEDALGDTLQLDGVSREIVGVLPEGFRFPSSDIELYVPLQATPTTPPRGVHSFSVVARLKPEASLQRVNAHLDSFARALEARYPDDNLGRGMWGEPTYRAMVGDVRERLWLLLGAVGLVLLVASVNVANLLLARAVSREQETAVRTAMGAGRGALVRLYLTESLLLSLLGGLAGLLFAVVGLRTFPALIPSDLPRIENVALNARVVGFTFGISLLTGAFFGILPALRVTTGSLLASLRESSRAGESPGKGRLRRLLVTAEIALAVALVAAAGLLLGSFWNLSRVDPGFALRDVVTVNVSLPPSRYPVDFGQWPHLREVRAFHDELLARLQSLPGIDSAALALNSPLDAGFTSRFTIEGRPEVDPGEQDEVRVRAVSSGYFRTAGIPVLRGRDFDERTDRSDSLPVLLVNEAFVRRYFPDLEPLGARIEQWGITREIVGVVKDVKFQGLDAEVPPAIYPVLSQAPFPFFSVLVRGRETREQTAVRVREAIGSIDRDLALSRFQTLGEMLSRSVAAPRFTMLLFLCFGGTALGLAAVGIYGVTSYSVRQRTREIGVRMSLGARKADVLRLVLGEGVRMAGAGIVSGLVLALVSARAFESVLFGVERFDPKTFLAVSLLAAVVGLTACYLPASRAARVDPVLALRSE